MKNILNYIKSFFTSRLFRKILIIICFVTLSVLFVARTVSSIKKQLSVGNGKKPVYTRENKTQNSGTGTKEVIDSWLDIDPDDEDITITWWIDNTTWDFYQLEALIYKRTGVHINFQRALRDDGTELSTYIAGTMPDVITITDYTTRVQLAEEGYVYSLSQLAKDFAPTLLDRIPAEEYEYYSGSDGELYGLANNSYDSNDIAEFEGSGNSLISNYAILVKQDYLNAYLEYKHNLDPNYDEDKETTTPEGFIEMCLWVKNHYGLGNDNPTVVLGEFFKKASSGSLSTGLSALMEYFTVRKEDENGNLVYQYAEEGFQEVLMFLNDLFNKNLLISTNFAYTSSNIITNIKNGLPFAVIGATHNYSTGFAYSSAKGYNPETKEFDPAYQYVPIVITNSNGDAPMLSTMVGRGFRVSMITKDAKRPDRIIKVFDYLMSEQGQRECYYGETGECYEFIVEPGEEYTTTTSTGEEITYVAKYGKIKWTDYGKELLGSVDNKWYSAGIKQISLLQNPMYVMLTSEYSSEMDTFQFYCRYDMKCSLIPYTYTPTAFKYKLVADTTQELNEMATLQGTLESIWIEAIPQIIMAPSNDVAMTIYNKTLKTAKKKGYEKFLEFQNRSYQAYKEQLGLTWGWLKNDPSYSPAPVKLLGYHDEYKKDIPSHLRIAE